MEIKQFSPKNHYLKALIYGSSGVGKTYCTRNIPNALYASAEGGLLTLKDYAPQYTDIYSMEDLKELYSYLKKGEHNFETLIIDSITEISDSIKAEIEKGKQMTQKDWGDLSRKMETILRTFRDLPMNVIFISQENDVKDEDKIEKKMPALYGKTASKISYFMDIVGYMHINKDGERMIVVTPNNKTLSKDRSNLLSNDLEPDLNIWLNIIKDNNPKNVKQQTEEIKPKQKEKTTKTEKMKQSKAKSKETSTQTPKEETKEQNKDETNNSSEDKESLETSKKMIKTIQNTDNIDKLRKMEKALDKNETLNEIDKSMVVETLNEQITKIEKNNTTAKNNQNDAEKMLDEL